MEAGPAVDRAAAHCRMLTITCPWTPAQAVAIINPCSGMPSCPHLPRSATAVERTRQMRATGPAGSPVLALLEAESLPTVGQTAAMLLTPCCLLAERLMLDICKKRDRDMVY